MAPVTPDIVLKAGRRVRKTKSMGKDDVPADLFLLVLPHMLPAVTHVYNLSLSQGMFPSMWKVSKICPLFKGGDQSSREEKIVCDQVMQHLYDEDLIHNDNHGCRRGHGTVTALIEAQEEALEALDTGNIMGIVTLDQSAAFDVIEHSILNVNMRLYGFNEHTMTWFQSYPKDRTQYVAIEASSSEEKVVGPYACPQGSCLGPLIWNLYCGEAAEVLSLQMKNHQDDTLVLGARREVKYRWKLGHLIQYDDDLMILVK